MNYTWNVMISWLLLQFLVPAQSSSQEGILVSSSNNISCDRNTAIHIVDLNVQQYTSCPEIKHCYLTDQQRSDIKSGCNEKKSCAISKIIPNSCVVNDYGHVSVLYSCTGIVNSSCTFEIDMCGWTIDGSDDYKWTLQANGHYVSTVSDRDANKNAESDLFSGFIVSSPKQCLTFWYHMYGDEIKTLKVFQLNSESTVELWSKSYSQGNKWYFQSLTLKDMEHYRIQFKATRGDGDESEIAVDDIAITNTVCKKGIDCNFERGQCGWKTEEPTYQWKNWYDSTPSGNTGPDVDHTLGTSVGGYIYLEAIDISQGKISNLTSETVFPDGDACFTFWYHMYGRDMGTLNVYLDSEELSGTVWSKSGNRENRWWLASIDISTSEPYTIIFEGIRGSSRRSDIALDDILLLSGSCKEAFVSECSYEEGKCNWSNYPEMPYIWKITNSPISKFHAGPYTDHTTGTSDGHYIFLERTDADSQKGAKSYLTSVIISPGSDVCFTFWYHMYGQNIGTLSFYIDSSNTTEMHWSQSGNQGNAWQFAKFEITRSAPYRIIFEGTRGNSWSDIALDDILLLQHSCSAFGLDCSFEEAICAWSNYPETQSTWIITKPPTSTKENGPYYDHTTGSADGHYIYLQTNGLKSVKYNLSSRTSKLTVDICFTFWYHMYGKNIGTLSVYTESGNTTDMHWSKSGNQGDFWQFASFDISKSEPYMIVFEGIRGDDVRSDIALDDILVIQSSCSGSINFSHSCHKTDESITLAECSNYYLQLSKTSFVFHPNFDDCSSDYQETQTSILSQCNDVPNTDICTFNLSKVIKTERRCFQSNRLQIEYKCEAGELFTTVASSLTDDSSADASTGSSSAAEATSTVSNRVASTGSFGAVSDVIVSLPTVLKKSSESATGLVVGLVIGGLLLACVVTFIVISVRRQTLGNASKEKVRNNLHENDYIGCQDIALPQAADHSGLMQFADTQTLNDDEYAIINPSAETSFNEVISDGNRTADSYMILDPNDTGFNRTPFSNTPRGYEFAKPVRHTEKNNGDEDQYAVSDGVYDHSGNNRHKELEDKIYNHAVDTVYDSGSHMRNNDWREDTYDHFHGQLTEDDYDISTTT